MEKVKFIDEVKLYLKGGKGGEGSSAKKRTRRGFLNWGGDGGKGADIYFQASPNIFDLSRFLNKKTFVGTSGAPGLPNRAKGRDAPDLVIQVPLGTLIKDKEGRVISDLITSQKVLIAKGGRGGKGNFRRRVPLPAQEGECCEVLLDFRIPTDVVILGETNTGKSTLISQLTNLKPKISEFPFTTQYPLWGVVKKDYKVFTILELPAIIGDKKEKLIGLKYLKHISRAKILVFLLDAQRFPYQEKVFRIKEVLSSNKIEYGSKYTLIVVNKIDKIRETISGDHLGISAKKKIGIEDLVKKIFYYLGR